MTAAGCPTALVVAKAPVPGLAKTRLAATVGPERAADLAAAALLDTLAACAAAFGPGYVSLAGDLSAAVRSAEIRSALRGWTVTPQRGDGFGERLALAHAEVSGPVVQVGMDTPQVTPALLTAVAAGLDIDDAVLGPADDGGWWVLALRDPAAAGCLRDVPMSTPTTGAETRAALLAAGLSVAETAELTDVDTLADAERVAAGLSAGRFRESWDSWLAESSPMDTRTSQPLLAGDPA